MPFECKQKVDKLGIEYYLHLARNISYPLRALSLPLSLYVVLYLNLCNLMLLFYRIISLVVSLTIESHRLESDLKAYVSRELGSSKIRSCVKWIEDTLFL